MQTSERYIYVLQPQLSLIKNLTMLEIIPVQLYLFFIFLNSSYLFELYLGLEKLKFHIYTAVGEDVCGRKGFVLIVTINKLVVRLVKIGEKIYSEKITIRNQEN